MNTEPLGKYVKVKGGFAFKSNKFVQSGVPIIRIGDLQEGKVDFDDVVYYPEDVYGVYANYSLKENDILIAMSGATTGKTAQIINCPEKCLLNQRVGKFEIQNTSKVLQKYLFFVVNSSDFQVEVWKYASGCAQPNISSKQLEGIGVIFPDIRIQKEIVSILERAENLKEKRQKANHGTNKIIQNIFYKMFGDPVRNERGWNSKTLDELCYLKGRIGWRGLSQKEYREEGPLLLTGENLNDMKTEFTSVKHITLERYKESPEIMLKNGDILLTKDGTIGKLGMVTDLKENATIGGTLALIRPLDNKILRNKFLLYLLSMPQLVGQYKKRTFGASIQHIFQRDLKKLKIIVPQTELQNQFAEIVKKIESIKEKQKQSTEEINTLFDALMQKAFKGKLVA